MTEIESSAYDLTTCTTCKTFTKLLRLLESYIKIIDKVGYSKLRNRITDKMARYRGEFFEHLDVHFDRIDEEIKYTDARSS